MTELTEAEIERLVYEGGPDANHEAIVDAVADLIDARLAPIRALADEWLGVAATCSRDRVLEQYTPGLRMAAKELEDALSADLTAPQPTSGTEGQDEGDEAVCAHENVRTFRSDPPHTKCLDCGRLVERQWITKETR